MTDQVVTDFNGAKQVATSQLALPLRREDAEARKDFFLSVTLHLRALAVELHTQLVI